MAPTTAEATIDYQYGKVHEIERQLMVIPSETLADFAAKAIVEVGDGHFVDDRETSPFWVEARALTGTGI